MPVYLFTYHAYRSWMPDRKAGFVQTGRGIQPPSAKLAEHYAELATHPPFEFAGDIQRKLIETALEVCERRDWRVHGAATESTHLHVIVSWRTRDLWKAVRGKIKNLLSLMLSRRSGQIGRPWFSEEASRKRVRDRRHFDYLMNVYLPRHSGLKWFEDRGWIEGKTRDSTRLHRSPKRATGQ